MFVLILFGLLTVVSGIGSIIAYERRAYYVAIPCVVVALMLVMILTSLHARRGAVSETTGVVSASPITGENGSASVNVISLPAGVRYVGLSCAESIGREQCMDLTLGAIVTVRSTTDEYGVGATSEIVSISP